jgi:hypothetical protein
MTAPGPLAPSPATAEHIGEQFGLPGAGFAAAPVARGLCGRVWRVTARGVPYALKELFWDDDQDEQEIRGRVGFERAARAAGVRCPSSLPTVHGDFLCRLPPALGDVYVRLYSWIDGSPLASADGAADWLGDCLARLHRLRLGAAGAPDEKFGRVPAPEQWQRLLSSLRSRRVPWADGLDRLLPAVGELSGLVTPVERDRLIMCHLDFTPANVMRERDGRLALIDWDNAGLGSADHELAAALMAWHTPGGRPRPDGAATTAAAYVRAGGQGRIRDLSSFSAHLGAVLNNLYTQASVAIATDVPEEHRDLAFTKVPQLMESLPTLSMLEQVGLSAAVSTS